MPHFSAFMEHGITGTDAIGWSTDTPEGSSYAGLAPCE